MSSLDRTRGRRPCLESCQQQPVHAVSMLFAGTRCMTRTLRCRAPASPVADGIAL
jgi:hypothetical protein